MLFIVGRRPDSLSHQMNRDFRIAQRAFDEWDGRRVARNLQGGIRCDFISTSLQLFHEPLVRLGHVVRGLCEENSACVAHRWRRRLMLELRLLLGPFA